MADRTLASAGVGSESDDDGSSDTGLLFCEPRRDEQGLSGFPMPWVSESDYGVEEPATELVIRSSFLTAVLF